MRLFDLVIFVPLVLALTGCGSHSSINRGFLSTGEQKKGNLNDLIMALESGDLNRLEDLKSTGMDLNARMELGRTPLIYSTIQNQVRVIDWLIKNGADTSLKDDSDKTALDHAIENESLRAWLLLDPQKQTEEQIRLLQAIRDERALKIFELLTNGVDPNFIDSECGETPLTLSVNLGLEIVVETLATWNDPLNLTTTNLNMANRQAQSPLGVARTRGFNNLVELLVQLGAQD